MCTLKSTKNILNEKVFNSTGKTFLPKKSSFNSASISMLSSLSNDDSAAKNLVLTLGNFDLRVYFWLYHHSTNSLQLKRHSFLHHINHRYEQSFLVHWFQTFLDRQIPVLFCAIECFSSCFETFQSVNSLIHSAAFWDDKFFPCGMFLELVFFQPLYIHSS